MKLIKPYTDSRNQNYQDVGLRCQVVFRLLICESSHLNPATYFIDTVFGSMPAAGSSQHSPTFPLLCYSVSVKAEDLFSGILENP
jgi:hypothetical protein